MPFSYPALHIFTFVSGFLSGPEQYENARVVSASGRTAIYLKPEEGGDMAADVVTKALPLSGKIDGSYSTGDTTRF